jgi:ABC-type transport system involved in multi-copper enzyme maturation permease subunit
MKINKKNLFVVGILVFFSFSIISPVFCKAAAAHNVIWDLEQDNYLLKNFYVDEYDNFYFSYKNTDENQFYFTKISDEGVNYYTKKLDPEPSFYGYLFCFY